MQLSLAHINCFDLIFLNIFYFVKAGIWLTEMLIIFQCFVSRQVKRLSCALNSCEWLLITIICIVKSYHYSSYSTWRHPTAKGFLQLSSHSQTQPIVTFTRNYLYPNWQTMAIQSHWDMRSWEFQHVDYTWNKPIYIYSHPSSFPLPVYEKLNGLTRGWWW